MKQKISIFIILLFGVLEIRADWSGTGFALNQGYIVTNYHVVESANSIFVKGIKGDIQTEFHAKVVATDKENDIAIIQIDDNNFNGFGTVPYSIKRGIADVGTHVWTIGYPLTTIMGNEIKFTDGRVSSKTGIQGSLNMYQISVPIQPGNSGGPLFDDKGNVIGITSAKLNNSAFNSENVNYAIKSSYLINVIESALTSSTIPSGSALQGLSLEQKIKLAKNFVFSIVCSDSNKNQASGIRDSGSRRMVSNEGDVQVHNPNHLVCNDLTPKDVIINSKYTILILEWNNIRTGRTWFNVSPEAYITVMNDVPKGKKYKLLDAEYVSIAPDSINAPHNSALEFILYFEPISKSASEICYIDPVTGQPSLFRIQLY